MYHHGLFITTILIILIYVISIVKGSCIYDSKTMRLICLANSTTKKNDLAFWERGSKTTASLVDTVLNVDQFFNDKKKLRLMKAKARLVNYFDNLRRTGNIVGPPNVEYIDSAEGLETRMSRGLRIKDQNVQSTKFLKKSRQRIINRLRKAGLWSTYDDIRFGHDTRKSIIKKRFSLRNREKPIKLTSKKERMKLAQNVTSKKERMKLAQEAEPKEEKVEEPIKEETENKKKKKNSKEKPEEKEPVFPYHILAQIQDQLIPIFPNVNITLEVLGRTVEYNDIVMMKAVQPTPATFRSEKSKYSDDLPEKKIIFIVHGLSVLGFKELPCLSKLPVLINLITFYFTHLDKFDIYLVPMANPDGVVMAGAKMYWNKNVSPQKACPGVAVDRNFDVAWNESHAVSSCSQLFPGTMPFSEIESVAIRETFHKYSNRIHAYMHVHAGTYTADSFKGDAVLYPRGYSESQSDDDRYIDLKGEIEETMKNASFKIMSVSVDTLFNWYGKVSGTSVDYASTIYGIPYAMELVMQLYADDAMVSDSADRETNSALTEIWQRVLNAIFENVYRGYKRSLEGSRRNIVK